MKPKLASYGQEINSTIKRLSTSAEVATQCGQIAAATKAVADATHGIVVADIAIKTAATPVEKAAAEGMKATETKNLKAAKLARINAVLALVELAIALIPGIPKGVAFGAAVTIGTYVVISTILTASLSAAAVATVVLAVAGIVISFISFFSKPPKVYWNAEFTIKMNEDGTFTFSLKTISASVVKPSEIEPPLFQKFKTIFDSYNEVVINMPEDARKLSRKYVDLPPDFTETHSINVDAGRATKGVEQRLAESLTRELDPIAKRLEGLFKHAVTLCFLQMIDAQYILEERARDIFPDLAYEVEGLVRKELERLSIKLMERREWTRQLNAIFHATFLIGSARGVSDMIHAWDAISSDWRPYYANRALISAKLTETDIKEGMDTAHRRGQYGLELLQASYGDLFDELHKCCHWSHWNYDATVWFSTIDAIAKPLRRGDKIMLLSEPQNKCLNRAIGFINYLFSEIPEDAANYIGRYLGSIHLLFPKTRILDYNITGTKPNRYYPVPSEQLEEYLAAPLNALMQDTMDLYTIWMKGYAEEWRSRMRTKVFIEALPNIRQHPDIVEIVESLGRSYVYVPQAEAERVLEEIEAESARLATKQIEEIKNYLPFLERSKDWIVAMFGVDEYERLRGDITAKTEEQIAELPPEEREEVEKYIEAGVPAISTKTMGYLGLAALLGYLFFVRKR